MSEGTAVIRRCVSCRKPITKQDYFINDDGPYCPDCIEAWACLGDQGAANLPPACSGNKPLRWRSGPVPHRGVRYLTKESGITSGRVVVKAGWTVDESDAWLPLSEILDLIGE